MSALPAGSQAGAVVTALDTWSQFSKVEGGREQCSCLLGVRSRPSAEGPLILCRCRLSVSSQDVCPGGLAPSAAPGGGGGASARRRIRRTHWALHIPTSKNIPGFRLGVALV